MEPSVRERTLWALLALLAWLVTAGCATTAQPIESEPGQGETGVSQDAPPTGTAALIKVDLNAIEPDPKDRAAAEFCPDLRGSLLQVVESARPAQRAQALGLIVRQDQVQVMLVLDGTDSAFLSQAGIEIGKQKDEQVQAYVPLDKLCELAAHKRVLAIYPASQAETP
jgi:hypothetical protein